MNVFDLYAKIALDTGEYENSLEDASGKTSSFADKLKTGLATAAKVGAAAIGAASTGIAALTKSSIEGYAEYEQLVGGVETLFGESAGKVQEYASNAFKTAGLSANEYMDTVTSFSASLLQSLGGDTEKAARYANAAITDMADNANKMGTSMESIQNAYQGFAKQNYTMLDNLKLGYGGTKEEMQRLLRDAEELEGYALGTYDVSSFSDIVEAIGIVQSHMGITGTTAKEASTTISGSVASMKSAWQNLVTGIADDNADLDTLIGNFVQSAETAAGNIIPRLTQILSGMGSAIEQIAPVLATEIPNLITSVLPSLVSGGAQLVVGLVTGLVGALPELISAVPSIISSLVDSISSNLPALSAAGSELLEMLTTGIVSGIPAMLEMLPQVFVNIYNWLAENLPGITEKGFDILISLVDGIIEAIPDMIAQLPEVITAMVNYFTSEFPTILKKGGELLGHLITGIIGAIPEIAVQLPEVITAIVEALEAGWEQIKDAGKYLLEGLWEGISDKVEWLKDKVSGVVDTIKGWFTGKDGFDEHSPSKWSKQVFRYVMEGGGEGLDAGLPGLMQSVGSVTDRVKSGLDFGTASVDFASSGLGVSSAGIINSIGYGRSGVMSVPGSIELKLTSEDGQIFGRWMVPFIRSEDKSNPEVVSDAV